MTRFALLYLHLFLHVSVNSFTMKKIKTFAQFCILKDFIHVTDDDGTGVPKTMHTHTHVTSCKRGMVKEI